MQFVLGASYSQFCHIIIRHVAGNEVPPQMACILWTKVTHYIQKENAESVATWLRKEIR